MQRVAVLALAGVMPFECGIPHRVLGAARDSAGAPLYDVETCSLDGRPVPTSADYQLTVRHAIELVADADLVVIPPFGSPEEPLDDSVCARVRDALDSMRPGARVLSICGAAYLLAAIGRLDALTATTHWSLTSAFRREFPRVRLDPGVLFVDNGDVLTAAGAAAGIDCCLHLVRVDHGAAVANDVARHCVVPPHREGGQLQFIDQPVAPEVRGAVTSEAREWALHHLDRPVSLSQLAYRSGVSVRSFTRYFRAETGLSPMTWLLLRRIDRARQLLEQSDLPVDQVAVRCGLGSGTSLRTHFTRMVGVSPSVYRRTFRGDAD